MLSVAAATAAIRDHAYPLPSLPVPLAQAAGCVLREQAVTDRDLPPFDRATMDGIAIAFSAYAAGQRVFTLEGIQAAGQPALTLQDPQSGCLEIMTGAPLPHGADTVIPYEEITKDATLATLAEPLAATLGQNIHRRGSDRRAGDVLLAPGCILRSPQIAILASLGRTRVTVSAWPRVAVVSVGDELVEVGRPVEAYQIRPSNAYGIRAALQGLGCRDVELSLLRDDPAQMDRVLGDLLARCDVLILSGGVSKGLFDFVPRTLARLGVREVFHRVQQKPGLPLWFGVRKDGRPVFALPGNPVSTLVCFHRYVLPWLFRSLETPIPPPTTVRLGEAFRLARPLTHFLPARLAPSTSGLPTAQLQSYHGSGDYASLGESDGFVELPPDHEQYDAGSLVSYYPWIA